MPIWKKTASLEQIRQWNTNTLVSALDINFVDLGEDTLTATMPITSTHHQPMGCLHGGASVVLAETLGSIAAHLAADEGRTAFGLEINASHLKAVGSGQVVGVARPVRIGYNIQVWDIDIRDESRAMVCVSRLTTIIKAMKT